MTKKNVERYIKERYIKQLSILQLKNSKKEISVEMKKKCR